MSGDRVVARAVDSAWRCDVCGERFTSNYMRQEHVQRDHPMTTPSPAAAGLLAEDVERVARALWEAHPALFRAVAPNELAAARRLAAAALTAVRPSPDSEAVSEGYFAGAEREPCVCCGCVTDRCQCDCCCWDGPR